jgi:ankyrin repeat protein
MENIEGQTALHFAVNDGKKKEVAELIRSYLLDRNNSPSERWTAPNEEGGHAQSLRLLLGQGVNGTKRDKQGWTAAHYAAKFGKVEF